MKMKTKSNNVHKAKQKRRINVFFVILGVVIIIGCGTLGTYAKTTSNEVCYATNYSSLTSMLDEATVDMFIEMYFVKGSQEAIEVKKFLTGETEGSDYVIENLIEKVGDICGLIADVEDGDVFSHLSGGELTQLKGLNLWSNLVLGVTGMYKNYSDFKGSTESAERAINGIKLIGNFLSTIGKPLPPQITAVIYSIDYAMTLGEYFQIPEIQNGLVLYELTLIGELNQGQSFTLPEDVYHPMLQDKFKVAYHQLYMQYYLKRLMSTIPNPAPNPSEFEYEIRFIADGKVISTETYTKNNPNINVPDVPSKKHYTGKWESFDLSSGGNKTVNAVYTPITYTVEFKTPFTGNSFLVEKRTYTIENQSIDEPTIRKKDHYDGYWGDYDLSRGGNKVVYAYYTPTVYTVTFYGLHMQVISVQEYTIENPSISEPDLPEVEGYVRGRWSEYSLDFHDTDVYGYYSESLEYTSNGDGTCYVSGIGTCTPYSLSFGGMYGASTIIQIPERSPKGEMVVGIGDHALESLHWAFEKVIIPNTVEYIGKYAFADNQGIAEFEFSKQSKLKSIGEGAFTGIWNLASFEIPDSVITIGELAFCGCWNLQNVIIGSQSCLDTIGCNAFSSCNLLTSITLPDSVTRIEDGAFYWSGLVDLFIPRNVTYIGTQICPSATIRVDSNNRVYHSSGNCVIETKKGILVTAGQNSVIPTDGSVKRIGKNAFAECSMESIVIPNSITQIDDGAFMFCWITDVYFWGTENEWNNIIVEDYTILNSTVHILGVQGKITGASLALGEKLTLKYYAAIFASNVNIIMRFTYEGETHDVIGVKDEKSGEYVYSLDRIPPSKMDAIVKAELILKNTDGSETVLAVKEEYSISQYCQDAKQDNPNDGALNHLLNDLENYSKAAEDYENGISKDPSDVDWEPLTDTDFSLSEPADETVRFKAAGVRFGFVNRLFFKFTADDLNGLTVKVNDTLYTESDFTLVEGTENTYIIYSEGINATEFDKIFTAVLLVNGEEVQTLEYSVKSYVEAKQDDPEIGALVRALYNYGKSSELYRDEM